MDEQLVVVSNLTKYYGNHCALNNISLVLPKGQIIGLLGPNGSGKTTLIKTLAGLLVPTSGAVTIDGHAPGPETKAVVSYLPERPYFNSWMLVSECLDFFEEFYSDFDRNRAEQMLSDLKVPTNAKLKTLSKGTKEKVQLVLVMARRAKLYLLDEPIAGVDPAARDYILHTIITQYNKEATVLISTHLIQDVEGILDRFLLLSNSSIYMDGDVHAIHEGRGQTLDEFFREVFRCSPNF